MEWLLEDVLRAKGDLGFLQCQLTHALACKQCNSSICLQSPGNLVVLFLFIVWQVQKWWQLGKWQKLQHWCSGDTMQGKGLQLLHHLAFLDCPWKQKSKEEEESSLNPLKPYSSKDTPTGNQLTAAPCQPSYSSESLPKATEIRERVLTQPPSPSRPSPTFQILTNLPVRNKIASGSSLQQIKSQLFWDVPPLHSESLETIFLSSDGPSPLKLSVCPSVFNKVAFPPMNNLLLPYYHSPTYYPTPEAHTMRNLEGMAPGSQLVQSPPSPLIPSVSSDLKPLPMGCQGILSDTETHTQWLTPQKEVPYISKDQALNPQPELQKTRPSTLFYSSEARVTSGDPSLHQHNPGSPSASPLYPSNPQEVPSRSEAPWVTVKHEHPKVSESAMSTASPPPTSLTEYQRKDSWDTELPVPSFLSAPLQEPHSDTEFVCRNVQEREASRAPSPQGVNSLQPTSWPPILARALKSEPTQPGLQKEEMASEAKAKVPSPQGGAVPGVCDHRMSRPWHWSRELMLRLQKLQQSPTSKSPGPHHSLCSRPALNSPTPESWGLFSCPPQTHPLSLYHCSSNANPPKVQRKKPQPVQAPQCTPSSSRAEQESPENKRMKWKVWVQTPSPGHVHTKANENCSNTGVLVSTRRQDKNLVLLSAQKKENPRKSKAEHCGGGTARLGSSTATGKNNPTQACRATEVPIHRFPKKSQYRTQCSLHTVPAQQRLPNAASSQDQQRAGLRAGGTQNPHYRKHSPWTPKKQLPSSIPQDPPAGGFQRLAKFLCVCRSLLPKSSQ